MPRAAADPGTTAPSPLLPLALAVGAVLVLRLMLGLAGSSPHLFPDEMGYLAVARGLVTGPSFALGPAPFYFPLYSVLIAPVFLLDLGPAGTFAGIMVVNAFLGAVTVGAVYAAARRLLGAAPGPAAWAAAVGGLFPGQALLTTSAWGENLLPLLMIGWLLAVHRLLERTTGPRAAVVVAAAVASYLTHPRAAVVVVVTAGLGPVLLWSRRPALRPVGTAAAVLITGATGGYLLSRALIARLLEPYYERSGIALPEGGTFSELLSPSRWDDAALRLVGVAWYQAAATAGLSVLGIWALLRLVVTPARCGRGPYEQAVAGTATALVALVAGLAVGAAAFLSDGERADNFFAGRYVDAATPMVIAAAVVWLLQHAPGPGELNRRWGMVALVLAGLGVAVRVGAPSLGDPRPFVGDMSLGLLGHVAIAGGRRVLAMSLVGVMLVGLGWAFARRRPIAAVTAFAISFAGLGVVARHVELARPYALSASLEAFADDVADLAKGAPVGVDLGYATANDVGMLGYQWFRPELRIYDLSSHGLPRSPWAIGALRSVGLLRRGAELVLLDPSRAIGLYVFGGPEQEALREVGGLLQEDFPAILPATTARSSITGAGEVRIRAGEEALVAVSIAHRGTRGRWARFDPHGAGFVQGRIRVGARLASSDGVSGPPGDWIADLSADVLPGQEASVVLRLRTKVGSAATLPPGVHQLEVDLYQDGVGWFSDRYAQQPHLVRLVVDP